MGNQPETKLKQISELKTANNDKININKN